MTASPAYVCVFCCPVNAGKVSERPIAEFGYIACMKWLMVSFSRPQPCVEVCVKVV